LKTEFLYNPGTCKYEPIIVTGKVFFKKAINFLAFSFLIGLGGLLYYDSKYPLWDEVQLNRENQALKTEWDVLDESLKKISVELATMEQNDDNNYRSILDLGPLPASIREAGVGGREKVYASIRYSLIKTSLELADKLKNRLDIEDQSLDALSKELTEKEKRWASRPAIQPISNGDLIQLYTTYGLRLHPILGYWRDHKGLDFTAPEGAPIYATGDGRVEFANGATTYGNVVFINHGYDFQTRYAHMTRYIVSPGEHVRRGQVIGYVGNTGLSFGNHCHYEVLFKGIQVNPINFFQRDLSNKEYEKLIELGGKAKTSLD
jgi:murein DD-endopeptidase MepM/ murein hydrolase activator NlpD